MADGGSLPLERQESIGMESSTVLAFRIFVMLSCLIIVPMAAIFGSAFPDVVKSVLVDRLVSLSTGKPPEPSASEPDPHGFREVTSTAAAEAAPAPRWGTQAATASWQAPGTPPATGAVVPVGGPPPGKGFSQSASFAAPATASASTARRRTCFARRREPLCPRPRRGAGRRKRAEWHGHRGRFSGAFSLWARSHGLSARTTGPLYRDRAQAARVRRDVLPVGNVRQPRRAIPFPLPDGRGQQRPVHTAVRSHRPRRSEGHGRRARARGSLARRTNPIAPAALHGRRGHPPWQ